MLSVRQLNLNGGKSSICPQNKNDVLPPTQSYFRDWVSSLLWRNIVLWDYLVLIKLLDDYIMEVSL